MTVSFANQTPAPDEIDVVPEGTSITFSLQTGEKIDEDIVIQVNAQVVYQSSTFQSGWNGSVTPDGNQGWDVVLTPDSGVLPPDQLITVRVDGTERLFDSFSDSFDGAGEWDQVTAQEPFPTPTFAAPTNSFSDSFDGAGEWDQVTAQEPFPTPTFAAPTNSFSDSFETGWDGTP